MSGLSPEILHQVCSAVLMTASLHQPYQRYPLSSKAEKFTPSRGAEVEGGKAQETMLPTYFGSMNPERTPTEINGERFCITEL